MINYLKFVQQKYCTIEVFILIDSGRNVLLIIPKV